MTRHLTAFFFALMILLIGGGFSSAQAQILYASAINPDGEAALFRIDLTSCEACFVSPVSPNIGTSDVVVLPDGTYLNISDQTISRLDVPPSVNILWQTTNPQGFQAGQLAPNGLVYLVGSTAELATYNPATNAITVIGPFPPDVFSLGDLFYIDGVLYANGVDQAFNGIWVEINVNDPAQSVITPWNGGYTDGVGGTWSGAEGLFFADASQQIYFYNAQDDFTINVCEQIDIEFSIISLTTLPANLPDFSCISVCTSDAGELTQGGPFNTCVNSTLSIPPAEQTVLDANDLLQYILYSNPTNPAGSILAVSNTPQFNFAPPMQTSVPYYVAAVVGNDVGGTVDFNDVCLDFSNALEVIWQPLPSIQLATPNANLCAGDCRTLNVLLTGTGGFTVAGNLVVGGNIIGTFSETFGGNTGTILLCVPDGTPPGSVLVQPTVLTDAWCNCE